MNDLIIFMLSKSTVMLGLKCDMVLSHLLLKRYLLPFRILLLSLSQVAFLDVVAVEHFFQLHICTDKLSDIDVIHILFTVEICLISHTTFL